jgi:hypothetical protein
VKLCKGCGLPVHNSITCGQARRINELEQYGAVTVEYELVANIPVVANKRSGDRHKTSQARREYMRDLMRRKRAAAKAEA